MTGHTLIIEDVRLSWWKGQQVDQIYYQHRNHRNSLSIHKVVTDATLWQILFYKDLGEVHLLNPTLTLSKDKTPTESLLKTISFSEASLFPHLTKTDQSSLDFSFLGKMVIEDGIIHLIHSQMESITLSALQCDISILKSQWKLKAQGKTIQSAIKGEFNIDMAFMHIDKNLEPFIDLQAHLDHFPVRIGDQLISFFKPTFKDIFVDTIGEAIDINLKLKQLPKALEIDCKAKSLYFNADIHTKTVNETVVLATPAIIHFQCPSKIIEHLIGFEVQNDFLGQWKIDYLSIPLGHKKQFSFQGTLKGEKIKTSHFDLTPFSLFVSTTNFDEKNFNVKIDSSQAQVNTAIYIPSNWSDLILEGQGLFLGNNRVDISAKTLDSIQLSIEGPYLKTHLIGGYYPKTDLFFLKEPAQIAFSIPIKSFESDLTETAFAEIAIEPFQICFSTNQGLISTQMHFYPFRYQSFDIKKCHLALKGDIKKRKIDYSLSTFIEDGQIHSRGFINASQEMDHQLVFKNLSTQFLDHCLPYFNQFEAMLGPQINGVLECSHSLQQDHLHLSAFSKQFEFEIALEKKGEAFELVHPAKIEWTLPSKTYQDLTQGFHSPLPFSNIDDEIRVHCHLSSLFIPLTSLLSIPQINSLQLSSLGYQGSLSIGPLAISQDLTKGSSVISTLMLSVQHNPFSITKLEIDTGQMLQAKACFNDQLTQFSLQGRFYEVPIDFINNLWLSCFSQKPFLFDFIGSSVSVDFQTSIDQKCGPIQFKLLSDTVDTQFDGYLDKGILTLKHPFSLEMKERLIDPKIQPSERLGLYAINSIGPVTLEVSPKGFSCPLLPFDFSQLQISKGKLHLRHLVCSQVKALQDILSLLQFEDLKLHDSMEIDFSPLNFQLDKGIFQYDSIDMTISNKYSLCSWGKIDFIQDQIQTVIGLTAQCIKQAWDIENLPDGYLLSIPIEGSLKEPRPQLGVITPKIAKLLILKQNAAFDKQAKTGEMHF